MQITTLAATILAVAGISAASIFAQNIPATAQSTSAVAATDALLTMPLLEERGWFVHAHNGRVRACSVDGASVGAAKTAPQCSDWSD